MMSKKLLYAGSEIASVDVDYFSGSEYCYSARIDINSFGSWEELYAHISCLVRAEIKSSKNNIDSAECCVIGTDNREIVTYCFQ